MVAGIKLPRRGLQGKRLCAPGSPLQLQVLSCLVEGCKFCFAYSSDSDNVKLHVLNCLVEGCKFRWKIGLGKGFCCRY